MIYNFYNLSSDGVFTSYYRHYELSAVPDDTVKETIIEKVYREKNYKGVTVLAEKTNTSTTPDIFLAAMSWLEIGNNTKAISNYKKVIGENNDPGTNLQKDDAMYYLVLTYIRNKDYDLALELMHDIRNEPTHRYYKRITRKFLRQVRMLKWR
jgi:hypothetical protein